MQAYGATTRFTIQCEIVCLWIVPMTYAAEALVALAGQCALQKLKKNLEKQLQQTCQPRHLLTSDVILNTMCLLMKRRLAMKSYYELLHVQLKFVTLSGHAAVTKPKLNCPTRPATKSEEAQTKLSYKVASAETVRPSGNKLKRSTLKQLRSESTASRHLI
jgi:hypothetical protein